MGKATTKAKHKYNAGAYRRYEISLGLDSKVNALLEEHKRRCPGVSTTELIKLALCDYFGLPQEEADMVHVPFRYDNRTGEQIPNNDLDKYFERR